MSIKQLANMLLSKELSLVTAESCTGGMIAAACTDVPGSSQWFERGFVTYSNEAKIECLGVQAETLATHGAVSEAVVLEMAQGALKHSHADIAIATSGIAGPEGGTEEKSVGLVWFGLAAPGVTKAFKKHFDGDRSKVRQQAVDYAIDLFFGNL